MSTATGSVPHGDLPEERTPAMRRALLANIRERAGNRGGAHEGRKMIDAKMVAQCRSDTTSPITQPS
jgi:hypothetical protein